MNCVVQSPTGYEIRAFRDTGIPCAPTVAEHYRVLDPSRTYLCVGRDIGRFGHLIQALQAAEVHWLDARAEQEAAQPIGAGIKK